MADEKEFEKTETKETKVRKRKQSEESQQEIDPKQQIQDAKAVVDEVNATGVGDKEKKAEEPAPEANQELENEEKGEQLSSLDMLWRLAFKELDEWAKRTEFRDEVFLTEAKLFVESIQRNRENIKAVAEKFNQEFVEWEKTARDEFLMSTTSLAHFFPLKSYEEINSQIDEIQKKTMSILKKPCQGISAYQTADKYLELIDHYIALRKKFRKQYLKTVKQAGNLIYENQKGFINLFAKQIKTFMFPLAKYLEKTEELTKS